MREGSLSGTRGTVCARASTGHHRVSPIEPTGRSLASQCRLAAPLHARTDDAHRPPHSVATGLPERDRRDQLPVSVEGLPGRNPRRRRPDHRDPHRQDHGVRRPVRLREDHVAADDQPDDRAHRRRGADRRQGHHAASTRRPCAAASGTSSRTPACSRIAPCWTTSPPSRSCRARARRAARAAAGELLARVGLDAAMGSRYPAQLSGGQQQRVGVARALAADPPVMLMDEPFSAVDPVVRAQLQDEFIRLQAELGKTIVFVTHDIDEAVKLGDQIAVFAVGGRLAQFAAPADVLSRPADDFVADFVGRDRGYRALSFVGVGGPAAARRSRLWRWASRSRRRRFGRRGDRRRRRPVVAGGRRAAPAARLARLPPGAGRAPGHRGRPRPRRLAGRPGRLAADGAGRGAVVTVRTRGCRGRRIAGDRHRRREGRAGRDREGPRRGRRSAGRRDSAAEPVDPCRKAGAAT